MLKRQREGRRKSEFEQGHVAAAVTDHFITSFSCNKTS